MTSVIFCVGWIGGIIDGDGTDTAETVIGNIMAFLFKLAVAIYTITQCHGTYKLLAVRQLLLLFFYGPFGLSLVAGQIKLAILLVCLLCACFCLEIGTLTIAKLTEIGLS